MLTSRAVLLRLPLMLSAFARLVLFRMKPACFRAVTDARRRAAERCELWLHASGDIRLGGWRKRWDVDDLALFREHDVRWPCAAAEQHAARDHQRYSDSQRNACESADDAGAQ